MSATAYQIEDDAEALARYVDGLCDREKRILAVAQEHLGDSFDLAKSIGFKAFNATRVNYDEVPPAGEPASSSPSLPAEG